jgi:hypothetical protein
MGFSDNQKIIWPAIIAVVLIAIAAIQVYRVNRPVPVADSKPPIRYTTGSIVDGRITVPAGGFLSYRIDLNRRAKLKGTFTTGKDNLKLACVVLREEDLENWKAGAAYKRISETGDVPRGQLDVALEPGAYYLIFDNRRTADAERRADAHFAVE